MTPVREWTLRPPLPSEDPGGTSRPVVTFGPPVDEWVTVVPAPVDDGPSILNGVVFDVIVERVVRSDPSSEWRVEVRMAGELLGSGQGTSYADGLLHARAAMVRWLERNEVTA